jgi:hypothetical protein
MTVIHLGYVVPFRALVSINYWNLIKNVINYLEKIPPFGDPIWSCPIFGARLFIFTRHTSMICKFLKAEYEWDPSNSPGARKGHAYTSRNTYIPTERQYSKNHLFILRLTDNVYICQTTEINSFHNHNTFSYQLLHITISFKWPEIFISIILYRSIVLEIFSLYYQFEILIDYQLSPIFTSLMFLLILTIHQLQTTVLKMGTLTFHMCYWLFCTCWCSVTEDTDTVQYYRINCTTQRKK